MNSPNPSKYGFLNIWLVVTERTVPENAYATPEYHGMGGDKHGR